MKSKREAPALKEGRYLLSGNEACAEGAITAGCRFFAGYPITPASEVMTQIVNRFPEVGGKFIQMEDEIGSMAALIGASWGGIKSMTATSGPGFSLMQENIGLAIITETPCVVVNVQRSGPSTGQATKVAQGDIIQSRWGTHGEHQSVVIAPYSVQSAFDLAVEAFNLSEMFRTPVIFLMDEAVSHTRETLVIRGGYQVYDRINNGETPPFGGKLVPDMPRFGEGKKLLITGSTHDSKGERKTSDSRAQNDLVKRLNDKIEKNREMLERYEEYRTEDADHIFVSFGISARSAREAVDRLRADGIKAGLITVISVWPFPDGIIADFSKRVKRIFVPELNLGQMRTQVERISRCDVIGINKVNSEPLYPSEIIEEFRRHK